MFPEIKIYTAQFLFFSFFPSIFSVTQYQQSICFQRFTREWFIFDPMFCIMMVTFPAAVVIQTGRNVQEKPWLRISPLIKGYCVSADWHIKPLCHQQLNYQKIFLVPPHENALQFPVGHIDIVSRSHTKTK